MASTPNDLRDLWRRTSVAPGSEVVLFYGHHDAAEKPWFSNFFRHDDTPFTFSIPAWCGIYGGQETVPIEFSEKAIMLCKASLMGDADVFARVASAETPAEAKRLGRLVEPWDETLWMSHICDIAKHIMLSKFLGVPGLRERLLATEERVIAEASPSDPLWGIGLSAKDPDARYPPKWKGANVLGWALMQARAAIRHPAAVKPLAVDITRGRGQAQAAQRVRLFDGNDVVVLVNHGSFNPVHVDHLQMMEQARNFFVDDHASAASRGHRKGKQNRTPLVLGIFGITGQAWLQTKNLEPEDTFCDEARTQMLERAVAKYDWLFVADAALSTKAHSARALIKMLQTQHVFPRDKKVRFIQVLYG